MEAKQSMGKEQGDNRKDKTAFSTNMLLQKLLISERILNNRAPFDPVKIASRQTKGL